MSVTLRDIAKESGFSVTTVSRALAGYDDVSEKTRQHIKVIANRLGYQPNHIARQLQGQRTNTIGFIMPMRSDFYEDDFFSLMLKGITVGATGEHYDVLTSVVHPHDVELDTYRRIVGGKRVDGVVIVRPKYNDERIEYLMETNIPFVVLGRVPEVSVPYIDVDNHLAFEMLTKHLIANGHRHIALIMPPRHLTMTEYRYEGYRRALQQADISSRSDYVVEGDLTYQDGIVATQNLLSEYPEITAIICSNDKMALGAMSAVEQFDRVVGKDIAITGYDGIPESERARTSLTTIHVPIFDLGTQITNLLIQQIEDNPTAEYQHIVVPELIVRESSEFELSH